MFNRIKSLFCGKISKEKERHCCADCEGLVVEDLCCLKFESAVCFLSVKERKNWVSGDVEVYYEKCSDLNADGLCPLWTPRIGD